MTDNFQDIQNHLASNSQSTNTGAPGTGTYNSINIPNNSNNNTQRSLYSTIGRNSFSRSHGIRIPSSPSNRPLNQPAINSFGHFASSYTRAQSFLAIEPPNDLTRARSYFVDEEEAIEPGSIVSTQHSFLTGSRRPSFSARFLDDTVSVITAPGVIPSTQPPSIVGTPVGTISAGSAAAAAASSALYDEDVLDNASEISSLLPQKGIFHPSRRRSSYLVPPQIGTVLLQEGEAVAPGTETEPVIVRTIEDKDGNVSTEVAGQSTVPQTIFNSVNVLIGIGLLSLPLGFKYSGWLIGFILLFFAASTTYYTAKLLSRCMNTDPTLVTYADIAYAAYGPRARILTSLLFTFELMGMGVSLVILFADSLNALFPQISKNTYKYIAFVVLTPPCFLPLRILSVSSIMGILSTLGLVFLVLFDGLFKASAPGSLWNPEPTHILPTNWMTVPLAIGIFMAPWGGHAVFPNIYRDMRHPQKYDGALSNIYKITFSVDFAMGVLGYLMFGAQVENEVTKSILFTKGYPPHQGIVITSLISLIPLAKTPLNARPIVSTVDILTGLDNVPLSFSGLFQGRIGFTDLLYRIAKASVRLLVVLSFVWMSIVFPDFDRIIAFFGATLCITICINGPVAFYLKIYGDKVPRWERLFNYALLSVYGILAIVGTIWCFIPPEKFQNPTSPSIPISQ